MNPELSLAHQPKLKVVWYLLLIGDFVGAARALMTHPWRGKPLQSKLAYFSPDEVSAIEARQLGPLTDPGAKPRRSTLPPV